MRVRKYEDFEKTISEPSPGSVFLVAGAELYQSRRLSSKIVAGFVDGMAFEHLRLTPDEVTTGSLARHLSENSLFASGRILDLSDVNRLSRKVKDELLSAAESLSGNGILCRTAQTRTTSGFLGKLEKIALTFVCWEPCQRDIHRWSLRLTEEKHVTLSREGFQTLEIYAAGVLERLADAVERLSLFYSTETMIDRDGVLEVLTGRAEHTVFELCDQLFSNRRSGAMDAMMSLLRSGEEPVRILAFLFSQWLLVNHARDIINAGGSSRDVSNELGIRYMQLDRIVATAGKASIGDPAHASEAFAQADLSLKSGGDSFTVLAGVIFALTSVRS